MMSERISTRVAARAAGPWLVATLSSSRPSPPSGTEPMTNAAQLSPAR
jgi:hypothetical protein